MCDYSLQGIPNRLAVEGDELVVHRFRTGTIGLAAASDFRQRWSQQAPGGFWGWVKRFFQPIAPPDACAVCVPPGALLTLSGVPKQLQQELLVRNGDTVCFTQVTAAAHMHRDALRLASGREILLQRLREGLHLRVVSLGFDEEMPDVFDSTERQWPAVREFHRGRGVVL